MDQGSGGETRGLNTVDTVQALMAFTTRVVTCKPPLRFTAHVDDYFGNTGVAIHPETLTWNCHKDVECGYSLGLPGYMSPYRSQPMIQLKHLSANGSSWLGHESQWQQYPSCTCASTDERGGDRSYFWCTTPFDVEMVTEPAISAERRREGVRLAQRLHSMVLARG